MKFAAALVLGLVLVGCGSSYEEKKVNKGSSGGVSAEQQALWDGTVKPIVDANCVSCHSSAGFVKSAAAFLGSSSKALVASGAMPKGKTLSAAQKAAIARL